MAGYGLAVAPRSRVISCTLRCRYTIRPTSGCVCTVPPARSWAFVHFTAHPRRSRKSWSADP